jgi:hypothetical protein
LEILGSSHRYGHTKDERAHNPDEIDKGISMADAVAALEHKTVETLGSTRLPTVQVETLELKK